MSEQYFKKVVCGKTVIDYLPAGFDQVAQKLDTPIEILHYKNVAVDQQVSTYTSCSFNDEMVPTKTNRTCRECRRPVDSDRTLVCKVCTPVLPKEDALTEHSYYRGSL